MNLFYSAPFSYSVTAFASAQWRGGSRVTSLRLKYAKEFLLHMLRSDYPLFPCFSSAFTWMILYFAGRKQVWMADKAAGFMKQSDQICWLGRWCGTTAMTDFGVIFIFVCLPLILNCLKALGEFFFICPWCLCSVSPMHVYIRTELCGGCRRPLDTWLAVPQLMLS